MPIESVDYLSVMSRRIGRHSSTVRQIWNQWVPEGHTEGHAGSQHPRMTNAQEGRHIVRPALQNRKTTSRNISQEMGMFIARQVSISVIQAQFDSVPN